MRCGSCASELQAGSRFCPSCGQPAESPFELTTSAGVITSPAVVAHGVNRLSSESIPVGGLTPGTVLAGRYRIIGLLGRGGMGEVYRADDMKLGQTVALKFLPREMSADPVWRERFFAEVRIARQLSHPNICRVYDVADVDGRHFLSMEYIDGEDLASLLKRVGYLSNEKALDVARQLAAGLAAAHAGGVLHRDLKPANIMIDGHGRARITDFGLAVAAANEPVDGDVAGTPAYMAPEQLAGKGATQRSDIYALGLVLYEVCCGRRAFPATTLAELRDLKEHTTPTPPADIRPGIDPVFERAILRCLERDPRTRPSSVAQLAATLPGGDPLAAAIAAGETPSPELVAASGLKEGLTPAVAVALLAFIALGSLATVWLNDRRSLVAQVTPSKPPDAMVERARTILAKAGYSEPSGYSASGFYVDDDVVRYVERESAGGARAIGLRALGAIGFFYRQSPASLVGQGDVVTFGFDPDTPLQRDGDIDIRLDGDGRLRSFAAIPVRTGARASTLSWPDVLLEAGLNPAEWTSVAPSQRPRFFVDTRVAWEGHVSAGAAVRARVEATALLGRMVTFDIVGPWRSDSSRGAVYGGAARTPIARLMEAGGVRLPVPAIVFLTAAFFARENLRIGRGDRRNATRLALFGSAATLASWFFIGPDSVPLNTIVGFTFLAASAVWVFYVAVEPFVRRRWPTMLVAWVRVLAGNARDPLVGRDVLIGCATGIASACLSSANRALAVQSGVPGALVVPDWHMLNGTSPFIGAVLAQFANGLFISLLTLFLLFVFRVTARSDWIALPLFALLSGFLRVAGAQSWATIPVLVAGGALRTFAIVRIGLVAAIIDSFVWTLFSSSPMTLQTSAWYASAGYASMTIVGAIAIYGFKIALGGRPVLNGATIAE
jgi:serine/threonine-protein kinase